jgi:2-phosphosulfolactate phosphatase
MPKVHLLLRKEEIDESTLANNKIAVVFDILLATSTITAALSFGAKTVIPVFSGLEAQQVSQLFPSGSYELVGEYEGRTIEGFYSPAPLSLKEMSAGKTLILSTTNGTVAIRKAMTASTLYIGSLLNGQALAKHIRCYHQKETIVAVCAGSSGRFCLEDFYGAGYFIACLLMNGITVDDLSDSAAAAFFFYKQYSTVDGGRMILKSSHVGRWLIAHGLEHEIDYISEQGTMSIIPIFQKTKWGGEISSFRTVE